MLRGSALAAETRNQAFPVIFFAGIHADDHRTTDDSDKADLERAARVAYRLGWQIAQGREAPRKIEAESSGKTDTKL